MKEKIVRWEDLTEEQQAAAVINYAFIRCDEEQEVCSMERAREEAPDCTGFVISDLYPGAVTCLI